MLQSPSDHLLRVFAREATSNRILDLCCGEGHHTDALARLGFDVFACDRVGIDVARERLTEIWSEEEAHRRITHAKPDALGYPDKFFDWVIAHGAFDGAADAAELTSTLEETRRVMKDGAWIYVAMTERTVGEDATPEALTRLFHLAEFATAGAPEETNEDGERLLRGIFRKVESNTPH